jgi:hypothetical protein
MRPDGMRRAVWGALDFRRKGVIIFLRGTEPPAFLRAAAVLKTGFKEALS